VWISGERHANFFDTSRFANDFNVHGSATDFAILDGRIVTLRSIGHRGDDFAAMRALDLDLDEHGLFLTELAQLTTEKTCRRGLFLFALDTLSF